MADNVAITPGSGATVATDDVGGVQYQRVKLDGGGDGAAAPILGDSANGLDVDVTRVQGTVTVGDGGATISVDDGGGSLTVDGTVAVSGTVPVSDAAGSLTVDSAQLPAALVGGRLDVSIGASVAVPVTDNAGSLSVDDGGGVLSVDDGGGSLTIDGTVTANQGTAGSAAQGWYARITDGTDVTGISTVSGAKALKVDVVQSVGLGAQADKSAFTEGSGSLQVAGAVVNDTIAADPAEDQAAALRMTAKRGLHVNLRAAAGTEIGTAGAPIRTDPTGTTAQPVTDGGGSLTVDMSASTVAGAAVKTADLDTGGGTDTVPLFGIALPASGGAVAGGSSTNPVRVDPTGSTTQPVSGTVTANQGGAPWSQNVTQFGGSAIVAAAAGIPKVGAVDEAGAAFSETNPLPVRNTYPEHTTFKAAFTYGASESDIAIFTPTGGKRFVVCGMIITPTAAGALLKIFDNTNAAANMIYQGQPPLGSIAIQFAMPLPAAAINNVLRYSTGSAAAGDVTVYGYEV